MLKIVIFTATLVTLSSAAPANVFEIDISPEEAQQYLNSPPFSEPQLSGKTAVLPLVRWDDPRFRSAESGPTNGHYWKNGQEIENTNDYVEEVYEASQFHGQDGLGGYAYGYQAPESSKVENRARSGEVTGSYTYKDGNDELIKVRYWADSEGFHQEDNIPKVAAPEPVQETEEVREARLAHQKAWEEAAAAAAQQPDPQGEYSEHSEVNYEPQYEQSASAPHSNVAPYNAGGESRQGKAYVQSQSTFQAKGQPIQKQSYSAQSQYSSQSQGYGNQNQGYGSQKQAPAQSQVSAKQYQPEEEVEPTGPPRGFFYSFNYPVSILKAKNAGQENQGINPGHPVDHDTVAVGY